MVNERLDQTLEWCREHKDKWPFKPTISHNKKNYNRYHRAYRKKSIKNLLTERILHLIRYSLKRRNIKKAGHLKDILGYSIEQLIKQLNKTIPEGYTWNDFLTGKLDIDHIKAIKDFNYDSQDNPEFKKCWALNNLRLLTIKENRGRGKAINRRQRA